MSANTRHERILQILIEKGKATVAELSAATGVSGKTIREDLEKLEQQGMVRRFHGGAALAHEGYAGLFPKHAPNSRNAEAKAKAAKRALDFVEPGDVIILDSGSTTLALARQLENISITVVTNDLFIIGELAHKDNIRLVVPGGFRYRNQLVSDHFADFLSGMNIHKAFISATGVHPDYGLTIFTQALVSQKQAMIRNAAETYCIVDHTKLNKCALITFAELGEIRHIITDPDVPEESLKPFEKAGIQLIR